MKLHLPKVLLSAVLTACCAFSAQATEIPDTYEQIDVWDAGYLLDYTTNTETDYYAFLLGMDIAVPSDIQIDGGNLLFTTYDWLPPVSLVFSGGDTPALSNLSSLTFDTLSRLYFADFSARTITTSGNLVIQNVNDGVDNPENPDVSFSENSSSATSGGAIYAGNNVTISSNGDVSFSKNSVSDYSNNNGGGAIYAGNDITISNNGDVSFSENSSSYPSPSSNSGGGAIYAGHNVNISGNGDVTFSENTTSSTYGGAIYADNGDVSISGNGDISFKDNYTTGRRGGAIYAESGDVSIRENGDLFFDGNYAISDSSAQSVEGGQLWQKAEA